MNKREIGALGEAKVVRFLEKNGCRILEKNYFCKIGEIDIIAKEKDITLFIEVKYRKNSGTGMPFEAVNFPKQIKIMRCAMLYAQSKGLFEKPIRFDVIEILGEEITWHKNAFQLKKGYLC